MKVGDTVPVNIGQGVVAQAKIVEMGDGTATLIIPATKVVMGVTTQLDTSQAAPTGPEHAILGVETPDSSTSASPDAPAEVPSANVVETPAVETPVVPADAVTPPAEGATTPAEATPVAQPVEAAVEAKPAENV